MAGTKKRKKMQEELGMPECKVDENKRDCPCTFAGCGKHGLCCDCLSSHLGRRQLPACAFPSDIAGTDERSIDEFISLYQERGGSWL